MTRRGALDTSNPGFVQPPVLYKDAILHQIDLSLTMFTNHQLTDVAPNVKTERFTIPKSLKKIVIPNVAPYTNAELLMTKDQWNEAWPHFIIAVAGALGSNFGEMFQGYYNFMKRDRFLFTGFQCPF